MTSLKPGAQGWAVLSLGGLSSALSGGACVTPGLLAGRLPHLLRPACEGPGTVWAAAPHMRPAQNSRWAAQSRVAYASLGLQGLSTSAESRFEGPVTALTAAPLMQPAQAHDFRHKFTVPAVRRCFSFKERLLEPSDCYAASPHMQPAAHHRRKSRSQAYRRALSKSVQGGLLAAGDSAGCSSAQGLNAKSASLFPDCPRASSSGAPGPAVCLKGAHLARALHHWSLIACPAHAVRGHHCHQQCLQESRAACTWSWRSGEACPFDAGSAAKLARLFAFTPCAAALRVGAKDKLELPPNPGTHLVSLC